MLRTWLRRRPGKRWSEASRAATTQTTKRGNELSVEQCIVAVVSILALAISLWQFMCAVVTEEVDKDGTESKKD